MSAYSNDGPVEGRLARILTAIIRQAGGEIRIKGEIADMVGEPTAFIKEWDKKTQELVLRCGTGSFVEVFRVVPERQPVRETPVATQAADPLNKIFRDRPEPVPPEETVPTPTKVGSTLDDEKLVGLEQRLRKLRVSRMLREEIEANKRQHERNQTP